MTHPHLIALAGVARCGKDDLAKPLIESGFKRLAFGDVIKDFYGPLIRAEEGLHEVQQRMLTANPLLQPEQLSRFYEDVLMPFWVDAAGCAFDPFTENDAEKNVLRPILEKGGDLIYDHVFREYFRLCDAAWSAGTSVVNPRLVRPEEGLAWRARGGQIILIDCLHREAVSQWEKDNMVALKRAGVITQVLGNWGTADNWAAFARDFAVSMTRRAA